MAGVERFLSTEAAWPGLRLIQDGATAQMVAKVINAQISNLSILFSWHSTLEHGQTANHRSGPATRTRLRHNV